MSSHPTMHTVGVICSTCGTEHVLRSAADAISADVCSSCHPAYTGLERSAVSGSRIDRFERRRRLAAAR
jgi:large subunit ribosomal protein L31